MNENLVMFQIPDIATFSIEDGKRIYCFTFEGYDEDVIRLYLLRNLYGCDY